ncbi:MAG: hypothetical protein VB089_21290 [Anaerolineaceae bacterium]|nr:hypothetical protein [Anaerolineaceae bacterium]
MIEKNRYRCPARQGRPAPAALPWYASTTIILPPGLRNTDICF